MQITKIEQMRDYYVAAARRNLAIGQCFATLARFEELVSGSDGVANLQFEMDDEDEGALTSGPVKLRFSGAVDEIIIGTFRVGNDGLADVVLGDLAIHQTRAFDLDRKLLLAWHSGEIGNAIRHIWESEGNHAA